MNTSTFNLFVVTISIAVCWAGVIPVQREGETKESCQSYFNGNTDMLCWTLAAKCYCFSTDSISGVSRLDWKNADLACRNEGMVLLSVESQEDDQLINRHIKTTQELAVDYYWTSGRYSQEGKDRFDGNGPR
ncbi:hypothetical protein GHT06_016359 [Daphnia sinensis]|uniref:C-type lectin domain-containing protein n=1 Tax=Daphnia sinensis TaxID=1820382 RepID=A0AAD5KP86_9CRUS|nr:hypothetical protein GHT06_016359 [Daphnia sinensis]